MSLDWGGQRILRYRGFFSQALLYPESGTWLRRRWVKANLLRPVLSTPWMWLLYEHTLTNSQTIEIQFSHKRKSSLYLLPPLLFYARHFRKSHYAQPILKEWGVMFSASWRAEYLHGWFEIQHGRLVCFPLFLVQSPVYYQYGLMDIYFILWVRVHYYFILLPSNSLPL